jgi:hypothetical protein
MTRGKRCGPTTPATGCRPGETWAGRVTYRLRLVDGELRLAGKQVLLVNREQALPTLAFLI